MALKTIYKTVTSHGKYCCVNIGIPTEERILLQIETGAKPYIDALSSLFSESEHRGAIWCVTMQGGGYLRN